MAAMESLSQFLSNLHTISILFLNILLLESLILLRSIAGTLTTSNRRPITAAQYLQLIESRNPTIRFSIRSKTDSIECAVCLSDFNEGEDLRNLECKHTFHRDCLDRWLQQFSATCPICRGRVLPEEIAEKYHDEMRNQVLYDGSDEEMIFLLSALYGNSVYRFF